MFFQTVVGRAGGGLGCQDGTVKASEDLNPGLGTQER